MPCDPIVYESEYFFVRQCERHYANAYDTNGYSVCLFKIFNKQNPYKQLEQTFALDDAKKFILKQMQSIQR